MDENERLLPAVGEVVPPETGEGGEAVRTAERGQSHEENRRYQAARRSGEKAGYERAMRELSTPSNGEEERREAQRLRYMEADLGMFQSRYPQVDLDALDASAPFLRFCGSRYGREPLVKLYEDYLELTRSDTPSGESAESKRRRATGTGGGAGTETLSAREQEALDEWNRAYPAMKMTAKEYLER